jgi:hypothetical protein
VDHIFAEIRAAVSGGACVLALFGIYAIPDIRAALGGQDGQTTGQKYRDWFAANLGAKYPEIDAARVL